MGDNLKPFRQIQDQINILKKRNMIFLNEDADANILRDYGYYEIINGYKDKFMIDLKMMIKDLNLIRLSNTSMHCTIWTSNYGT